MDDINVLYGRDEEFRSSIKVLPWIKFPEDWFVKVIGPFAGASARFLITDDIDKQPISIYADLHDRLGFYRSPYWEVYPVGDDNVRCDLNNVRELIEIIKEALKLRDVKEAK